MLKTIHVKKKENGKIHQGLFTYNDKTIPCCLGRSGLTDDKKEGDGATPIGTFKLLYGFHRQDRITLPHSRLSFSAIQTDDGWCDAPENEQYNALIKLPFDASHEIMMRKDRLYDVCIVLDYNIKPAVSGLGSAIFFHQTSPEQKPTEGCVAIDPEHMREILPLLSDETVMIIQG